VNNYALIWVFMNTQVILSSCKMILSLPILVFCCEQEWDVIFSISFFCGKHLINIFLSLVPIYKPKVQWEWGIFPKNTSQCSVQVSNLDTLIPRGCTPFGEHQESRPLARPDFLSLSFFLYSWQNLPWFQRRFIEEARSEANRLWWNPSEISLPC